MALLLSYLGSERELQLYFEKVSVQRELHLSALKLCQAVGNCKAQSVALCIAGTARRKKSTRLLSR